MVLGRERELEVLGRFVGDMAAGPSAALLEGSAGIGKTTLWLEALAMAEDAGSVVLSTRASESEARWSYAGRGDLLTGSVAAFPELPESQRRALEAALLRGDAPTTSPDQLAVSLAVLAVIRRLAEGPGIVLAIDDVQWLDASTARVLSFVLRRLTTEPVAVIATLRVGSGAPADPLGLDRAMPALVRIAVGPMPEDPLGRLLRERTDTELPHPVITRLHTA